VCVQVCVVNRLSGAYDGRTDLTQDNARPTLQPIRSHPRYLAAIPTPRREVIVLVRFRVVWRPLLAVLVCVVVLGGDAPALAGVTQANPQDQCKDGGWQALEREDGTPFANQGDCVSYAAQGGFPTASTLSVEWKRRPSRDNFTGEVTGTGLQPNAAVTVSLELLSLPGVVVTEQLGTVGPDGTFAYFYDSTSCGFLAYIVLSTVDRNGNLIEADDPIPC
jgi:hypothetical protein